MNDGINQEMMDTIPGGLWRYHTTKGGETQFPTP